MVAEKWFGFQRGERLTVHIADGVTFVNECVSANKHGKNFSCFNWELCTCVCTTTWLVIHVHAHIHCIVNLTG